MDINKSMDIWRLISIKTLISIHGYLLLTDIHGRMSFHGNPCLDINVDIHTCMDSWRLTSKNHGYLCWYPCVFGNPCMDVLGILGLGHRKKNWPSSLHTPLFPPEPRSSLWITTMWRTSKVQISFQIHRWRGSPRVRSRCPPIAPLPLSVQPHRTDLGYHEEALW